MIIYKKKYHLCKHEHALISLIIMFAYLLLIQINNFNVVFVNLYIHHALVVCNSHLWACKHWLSVLLKSSKSKTLLSSLLSFVFRSHSYYIWNSQLFISKIMTELLLLYSEVYEYIQSGIMNKGENPSGSRGDLLFGSKSWLSTWHILPYERQ